MWQTLLAQWERSPNPDWLKAAMLVGIAILLLYIAHLVRGMWKEVHEVRNRNE